jgi:DNA-binding beta-propeller fold protein YncE
LAGAGLAAAPQYRLVRCWTNPAGMPHPLQEAHAACFDRDGNVILVDSIGARVHRFTPEGRWLGEIGAGPGSGPAQFQGPREAAVNRAGEIYIADTNNYRIQVFTSAGKFLRMFGERGSGPGQLLRAHGLAFSPDGRRLYVADVDNHHVTVFDPAGKFLFSFGQRGERPGELRDPHGIGVDGRGDVYVGNYYGPVQKFTAEGKFLQEYGAAGFRGWIHFHSLTADRHGNVYLAARDAASRNAVVMYDRRGRFVTEWTVPDEGKELQLKSAVADPAGRVWVTVETGDRHGLAVFERK